MTAARHHARQTYSGLKTATRLLIDDLGGIDAASHCSRVQRSVWSDYGNPNTDKFIPVDVAMDAEAITGRFRITSHLAAALGCVLTPISPRAGGDVADSIGRISVSAGGLMARTILALSDGILTEAERADLHADLAEHARVTNEALALLRREEPRPAGREEV